MLLLDTKIKLDKEYIESSNVCDWFSMADLQRIGRYVYDGYQRDDQSRSVWVKRNIAGMNLALQVSKDKTAPWVNCSNVVFPLVTISALQFGARAYSAIISGPDVVKCRINGEDPQGKKAARAKRISSHMSYQVLEEDDEWEEQHDKLLLNLSIVGTAFKKSYRNAIEGCNRSDLVLAQDLVLDYYAKSIETCRRKTHIIPLYRNDIYERIEAGIFRDVRKEAWYNEPSTAQHNPHEDAQDKQQGKNQPLPDDAASFKGLEQHCWLDLDGDGYEEPYIVTIEESSQSVLRIVARFSREEDIKRGVRGNVVSIRGEEYFTKYGFIPSPDGGIYDIGLGVLLGPLNEATNSLINQIIDAGTIANSGGGFLGKGARLRGGNYDVSPLKWHRVDSSGDDLKNNIVPFPKPQISQVLFSLLSLIIDYTNRIAGASDALVGENPGQNTPASTNQSMIEQGMQIYNSIFKRIWRSMKQEFKKLYLLNATYLPTQAFYGSAGNYALREDYLGNPEDVVPAADPRMVSGAQQLQRAMAIKQAAMTTPGYNRDETERRFLRALGETDIDTIFPGSDKVPPLPNPKMQVEQGKMQVAQLKIKAAQQEFIIKMMEERRVNSAKILQMEAQAIKLLEEAKGVGTGHQIAAFEASIGALKEHDSMLRGRIETMLKIMEQESEQTGQPDRGGMAPMAGKQGNEGATGVSAAAGTGPAA